MSIREKALGRAHWPRSRWTVAVLLLATFIMPAVLVINSWVSTRELRTMQSILLRDRSANIAARLEVMKPEDIDRGAFDPLLDTEPALQSLRAFGPTDVSADPNVEAIRSGRELYRTLMTGNGAGEIYTSYIPFHSWRGLYVARIDLSTSAADLVLTHARHNLLVSILSGFLLLTVSAFALWTYRRAALLVQRQLQAERLAELGTLSAVLAHEIRNPLGAIKGFAQLARENAGAAAAKPLDAIVRESLRLEALVESLLLYARPVTPSFRAMEWEAFAEDLRAHAASWIGARPIRFETASDIESFSTDPSLLKQALLNLVRNAIESIPDHHPGEVQVRVHSSAEQAVQITVTDDGTGVPEAVRKKLFAPFMTTKASGTGLGLPVSKKIIESLGGTLSIEAAEQRGTRAKVELHGSHSGS
jgi:two-component system, NtrC family, sensor histidine kinase HydH